MALSVLKRILGWQYHCANRECAKWYAHIAAHVWSDDGRLVAISRQTVTVFGQLTSYTQISA